MQLDITGHHVEVTKALKDYVNDKIVKLERHFDHMTNGHVILSVEKLRQKAEATVHLNGATIYADAIDENMYAAIDALIDKLDRQVLKHKERFKTRHRSQKPSKSAG
ncbi:MAG: ribosome hibernation promoting factor [Gammaproteobacteria bacterium]|nr:MAG: ribosome hibernation promoting factor [Gammaproteobacteria bacterium]